VAVERINALLERKKAELREMLRQRNNGLSNKSNAQTSIDATPSPVIHTKAEI
jgi:hypothetical protein